MLFKDSHWMIFPYFLSFIFLSFLSPWVHFSERDDDDDDDGNKDDPFLGSHSLSFLFFFFFCKK